MFIQESVGIVSGRSSKQSCSFLGHLDVVELFEEAANLGGFGSLVGVHEYRLLLLLPVGRHEGLQRFLDVLRSDHWIEWAVGEPLGTDAGGDGRMELAELLFCDTKLLLEVGPLGFDLVLVNRLPGGVEILDGIGK